MVPLFEDNRSKFELIYCFMIPFIKEDEYMHSYAIFTTKRGRPNLNNDNGYKQVTQKRSTDTDVILCLLYLKKLTTEQLESAKYYESLCLKYYRSIECPEMRTSSIVYVENSVTRTVQHHSAKDVILCQEWLAVKQVLARIDNTCESILYKVVIENKMKYELLNPVTIMKNPLKILQLGLDSIIQWRLQKNVNIN